MPDILEMTNGEIVDLDEADGQYRYLATELCRFGAASTTLSVLSRLYQQAKGEKAKLEIIDRLSRKRDTFREYIKQADEQQMPEWVARYTEIHDAYQEAIDMIEECIVNAKAQFREERA